MCSICCGVTLKLKLSERIFFVCFCFRLKANRGVLHVVSEYGGSHLQPLMEKKKTPPGTGVPTERCAGGNNHFSAHSLKFFALLSSTTFKKCYKTGSHWQTKSPRRQVKQGQTPVRAYYSLFYKNSGIEITWSSPDTDISIHFCI